MTCCRVAMEIETAGWFENAMQFYKSGCHHDQIGHHLVTADKVMESFNHLCHVIGCLCDQFLKCVLSGLIPMPGVLEGGDLGFAIGAALIFEEDIVIAIRVERRVQIDQVYALGGDVFTQDVEIVSIVECVHGDGLPVGSICSLYPLCLVCPLCHALCPRCPCCCGSGW